MATTCGEASACSTSTSVFISQIDIWPAPDRSVFTATRRLLLRQTAAQTEPKEPAPRWRPIS